MSEQRIAATHQDEEQQMEQHNEHEHTHEEHEHTHDEDKHGEHKQEEHGKHDHNHEEHEHGDGGHSHDEDGHKHAQGFLGILQEAIPFLHGHSHGEAQIDAALESNARGIWALKISLIGLGVTALFQVIIA